MKRYFGVAVAAGVLAGSMQMSADEAISITVRPAVTSYRGNAQLKVLVSRNEKKPRARVGSRRSELLPQQLDRRSTARRRRAAISSW